MYLRINAHAVTIMMLTTDDAICEPVTEIIDAARQQQQAFETMLAQPGQAEPRDANEFTPEILEYDKTLESARKTLLTFGHEHWTQDFDA